MALRAGRRQSTPGLNWYVGSNIQFMFDYVKQMGARSAGNPHAACATGLRLGTVV
jgi:phosphate-selective porin